MSNVLLQTEANGICLCGSEISVGYDDNGLPWVIHRIPTCKHFDRIDVNRTEDLVNYLAAINNARVN